MLLLTPPSWYYFVMAAQVSMAHSIRIANVTMKALLRRENS